jgi:DNA-binding CsgD family transcriptional regulator
MIASNMPSALLASAPGRDPTGERTLVVAEHQIEVLAALNIAAALVDRHGNACLLNEPAKALLGGDIIVRHRKLLAADAASNRRLQALVAVAIDVEQPGGNLLPVAVLRRDRRPLLVTALWLGRRADPGRRNFVILLLADMEARPELNCAVLQEVFGLTIAEAWLARLIAVGESLEDAAARLGITKNTARQRLKLIFAKTDTRRQGELVCLLSSLMSSSVIETKALLSPGSHDSNP